MKIGTDGVLLGAWAASASLNRVPKNILDVGCGTGIVALMLAQRFPEAEIDALDIDEDAVCEASENALNSPFAERVKIIEADFVNFQPQKKYDLIVSNPPFFNESIYSPDCRRASARHESSLSMQDLLTKTADCLSPEGRVALVYPINRLEDFLLQASLLKLYPLRITTVFSKSSSAPIRFLAEVVHSSPDAECVYDEIVIRNADNVFSDEYKFLLKDFYLAF